ncbi:unnamed protein product [Urochloa humidicola]
MQMLEGSTEQSDDRRNHLKRLYEYTKKAITFEAVLLSAICSQQSLIYSNNTAFKVSLAMLLLAFFTNLLTGILILNSLNLAYNYPIYMSSVIQMLMPFALLVSSGQLQPYMILISVLPFFSIALFHRAATDTNALDHIFDISAGVYALLSAGCALANPYFISKEPVAASPLACSLCLTILIARYLMLISTLRPPVIVEHADTLMFILKLLLALTLIFLAVEFLGWLLALVVIFYGVIDGVLFFMGLISNYRARTIRADETSDQWNDQQILSTVFVGILFMALTQTYAEHAAAHEASLGSATMLRMLLYFGAFLWSINRMLIAAANVAALPVGRAAAIGSALEWARASVVVVAALDMIYKFVIAFIVA